MEEWTRFLQFAAFGAFACAVYDLIRIFRRMFLHEILWISLEDFFYWSVMAGCFFLKLCQSNNGILRGYILLGLFIGAVAYDWLFGRFFVKYAGKGIQYLKKRLKNLREMATIKREKLRMKKRNKKAGKKHESE